MFRKSIAALALATTFLASEPTHAEDFPNHPIKVIVPNGAGGSTDITSRLVAQVFAEKIGQSLAIVNMGGGGTSIGAMEAARSKADGYTLLSTHEAFLTSSAMGVNTLGPNSVVPIAQTAKEVIVVAVRKDSPLVDLAAFYDAAENGDSGTKLKLGVNPGAANHFFFLSALSPIEHDVTFVPTGGGASSLKALLGGTIDAGVFAVSESIQAIRSGDIVPVAVFDSERHADLPEISTATEQGYEVLIGLHYVWYAPKGTPEERVAKLAEGLSATMSDDAFKAELESRSITPALITGDELSAILAKRFAATEELANTYVLGR